MPLHGSWRVTVSVLRFFVERLIVVSTLVRSNAPSFDRIFTNTGLNQAQLWPSCPSLSPVQLLCWTVRIGPAVVELHPFELLAIVCCCSLKFCCFEQTPKLAYNTAFRVQIRVTIWIRATFWVSSPCSSEQTIGFEYRDDWLPVPVQVNE